MITVVLDLDLDLDLDGYVDRSQFWYYRRRGGLREHKKNANDSNNPKNIHLIYTVCVPPIIFLNHSYTITSH